MSPVWTNPVGWSRAGLQIDLIGAARWAEFFSTCSGRALRSDHGEPTRGECGGRSRDRTFDLGLVRAALSRLSYPPGPLDDRATHRSIRRASRKGGGPAGPGLHCRRHRTPAMGWRTGMRTVAVALVVVASAFDPVALALALPPEDLSAYCRATYPQVPFQIRCMSLERASQDRVGAARSAIDPATWNRCQSGSPSWTAMEACLAQPTAGTPPAAGGAAIPPAAPATEPADEQARRQPAEGAAPPGGAPTSDDARGAPGTAPTPAPPVTPAPPPATASGSGSTIILGPQANPALSAPPENRPTRPISEAEADRQLRNILERTGGNAARCTKRQYGPGWVIVCD